MPFNFCQLFTVGLAALLCSCAATSVQQTWRSPVYQVGQVQKVAVLGAEERERLRAAFENRFVAQLKAHGQDTLATHTLLSWPQIKADKQAAASRLREAGADAILIIRLVDQAVYDRQVWTSPVAFVPGTVGYDSYGWYDMEMGTTWSNLHRDVYLDSSLYDLRSGKRVWSCLTKTALKERMDRLAEIDPLADKVLSELRKDGLVR